MGPAVGGEPGARMATIGPPVSGTLGARAGARPGSWTSTSGSSSADVEKGAQGCGSCAGAGSGSASAKASAAILERLDTDPDILADLKAEEDARRAAAEKEKQDKAAEKLWSRVRMARGNKRPDLERRYLEQIIKDFPDTEHAEQAEKDLAALED